jgi:uncharacterized protein (DUF39 family)
VYTVTIAVVGRAGGVVKLTWAVPVAVTAAAMAETVTVAEPTVELVSVTVSLPLLSVVAVVALKVPALAPMVSGTLGRAVPA